MPDYHEFLHESDEFLSEVSVRRTTIQICDCENRIRIKFGFSSSTTSQMSDAQDETVRARLEQGRGLAMAKLERLTGAIETRRDNIDESYQSQLERIERHSKLSRSRGGLQGRRDGLIVCASFWRAH